MNPVVPGVICTTTVAFLTELVSTESIVIAGVIFLTLNTLLVDGEIKQALEDVCELYTVGLDGVIVQDLGIEAKN